MKILYVEDQNPGTIITQLTSKDTNVVHCMPDTLENVVKSIDAANPDIILLDFRLTNDSSAIFDAPTVAQTIRTKNSSSHKDIPIVLASQEDLIADFYDDYSSQDLFDLSINKDAIRVNPELVLIKFTSFISAYKDVINFNFNIDQILKSETKKYDSRINVKLKDHIRGSDVFAFTTFVYNRLIRTIGVLIGEDVLSARLGVSKSSADWTNLKNQFEAFKYQGIFSDAYERWWAYEIEDWWKSNNVGKNTLRRLSAEERVEKLKSITGLEKLDPIQKLKHSRSSRFWTICKEKNHAIDPIDGLELNERDLLEWQEKEYISILAGLENVDLFKKVTFNDKQRLRDFNRDIENA